MTSGSSSRAVGGPDAERQADRQGLGPLDVILDVQIAGLGVLVGRDARGTRKLLARLAGGDGHGVLQLALAAAGQDEPLGHDLCDRRPVLQDRGPAAQAPHVALMHEMGRTVQGAVFGAVENGQRLVVRVRDIVQFDAHVHPVPFVGGLDRAADVHDQDGAPDVAVRLTADPHAAVEHAQVQRMAEFCRRLGRCVPQPLEDFRTPASQSGHQID